MNRSDAPSSDEPLEFERLVALLEAPLPAEACDRVWDRTVRGLRESRRRASATRTSQRSRPAGESAAWRQRAASRPNRERARLAGWLVAGLVCAGMAFYFGVVSGWLPDRSKDKPLEMRVDQPAEHGDDTRSASDTSVTGRIRQLRAVDPEGRRKAFRASNQLIFL